MSNILRSSSSIATDIDRALKVKKMTLKQCVDEFNSSYASTISNNNVAPLNKDFIQRIRRGKYKVVTERVIKLCLYLKVNPYEQIRTTTAIVELNNIELLIKNHPELEQKLISILREIYELVRHRFNINLPKE